MRLIAGETMVVGDYRALLLKYIRYIGEAEGADFILDTTGRHVDVTFTPEEWAELERLAREVRARPPQGEC